MNRRFHLGRVILLGLSLMLAVPLTSAQTTSEKLQQLQNELQQQKQLSAQQAQELQRLRQNIQNLSAQQKQTLARLDALANNVSALENEISALNARTALAERQLADLNSQIALTQARVDRLQTDVREILNTQYRDRSGRYLQLMSQSRSLSDLMIRMKYSNIAGQYNTQVIQTLRGEVLNLKNQQELQAQQTKALKDLQAKRNTTLTTLKAKRAEQGRLLAQLRASEQGQRALATQRQADQALTASTINQLVTQVVAERNRIEAERQRRLEEERRRRAEEARKLREAQERARLEAIRLARLRAEQERLQQQRAAQLAAQRQAQLRREQAALQARQQQVRTEQQQVEQQLAPLPTALGPLGFPLPGGQVSAPYGTAGSPWIVLSGNPDAQAVAAQEGNVLAVTYYASLGWVILIDHSSAVSAYFGLRDPQVSVGNRVGRGTPLGTVGGSSIIGPDRMAFQLRRGGTPVNPGF